MTYTLKDVGTRLVDGIEIPLSDEEAKLIADEWNENEIAAQTKQAAEKIDLKRIAAESALQAQRLSMALLDPASAPQEVKDYAKALQAIS